MQNEMFAAPGARLLRTPRAEPPAARLAGAGVGVGGAGPVMLVDAGVPGVGEVAARAVVVAHADGAETSRGVDAGGAREVAEGVGERLPGSAVSRAGSKGDCWGMECRDSLRRISYSSFKRKTGI